MSFVVSGLDPSPFQPLFGLDDGALAARGIIRKTADAKPGYPCRISLEDAEPGDTLLLLNHESHDALTPYRSSYAIFVNERAQDAARYENEIPPVMRGRPMALRLFDADGMLIGADLALKDDVADAIGRAFENPNTAYIHAHNAAHGCFAAKIDRA